MNQQDLQTSHFLVSPETVLPENRLDRISRIAAELCGVPYAAISISLDDRNVVKSSKGKAPIHPDIIQSIRDFSLSIERFTEFNDFSTFKNPNFGLTDHGVLFYAGATMRRANGTPFGSMCIWDYEPRNLTPLQQDVLKLCAQSAGQQLELSRLLSQSKNRSELAIPERAGDSLTNYWKNFEKLTPREKQVLHVILENTGNTSNKQIARTLDISPRTVELHRARIFTKMQVRSAAELISFSLRAES